ncbi:alpha/beta hydrolase [soil metagenome]
MKRSGVLFLVVCFSAAVYADYQPAQSADQKRDTEWHSETWKPAAGFKQIPIWPGLIPDAVPVKGPEEMSNSGQCVGKVSTPTMTVYPAKGENSGAAVVIFPGGGYWILAMDIEGTDVCDWLTARGVTCVLLKYRVPGNNLFPRSGCYPKSLMALEDAQRTLRLVRSHASEWHINPNKIGVLGFSAGGHLVAATSTLFDKKLYKPVDAADKLSCRPDFAVALYPGHLLENTTAHFQLNPYIPITRRTPPTFIVQAENDPVDDVQNSLVYFAGLKKAGVPAEMHIYADGKHAFGLKRTKLPITRWTELAELWMKSIGVL